MNIRNKKKKPGTIFSDLIFKITGEKLSSDDSYNKKKQMNQWGWLESWNNRKIILKWLIEEAEKRGYKIGEDRALSLLREAFKAGPNLTKRLVKKDKAILEYEYGGGPNGDIAHQGLM